MLLYLFWNCYASIYFTRLNQCQDKYFTLQELECLKLKGTDKKHKTWDCSTVHKQSKVGNWNRCHKVNLTSLTLCLTFSFLIIQFDSLFFGSIIDLLIDLIHIAFHLVVFSSIITLLESVEMYKKLESSSQWLILWKWLIVERMYLKPFLFVKRPKSMFHSIGSTIFYVKHCFYHSSYSIFLLPFLNNEMLLCMITTWRYLSLLHG
jgi:hypothetical protein